VKPFDRLTVCRSLQGLLRQPQQEQRRLQQGLREMLALAASFAQSWLSRMRRKRR
jgi:hypothetical protein